MKITEMMYSYFTENNIEISSENDNEIETGDEILFQLETDTEVNICTRMTSYVFVCSSDTKTQALEIANTVKQTLDNFSYNAYFISSHSVGIEDASEVNTPKIIVTYAVLHSLI